MEDQESHIGNQSLKSLVRSILQKVGLNLAYSLAPGISIFGLRIFRDSRPSLFRYRASYAIDYALNKKPKRVLDVGSGGGQHARQFKEAGCDVLCVDYGTSVYAQASMVDGLRVIHTDFNKFVPEQKYDLVWASHILEHQRNVGDFIERLIDCCSEDGIVCITVPDPHRRLWGGHVTLWTPGLLAYNFVLCGVDISKATFVRGSNEFSLFFNPCRIVLPDSLTFDYGDLNKLAALLPQDWRENGDPWKVDYDKP
jgi:2-polyprenyl-3-methyl-5-hydroxy-6-metoxy-1,4-benzoquinol methylase